MGKSLSKKLIMQKHSKPGYGTALFHTTGFLFLAISSILGAVISGYFSKHLVTGVFHILHAHTAFMGFGIFMVTGHLLNQANTSDDNTLSPNINAPVLYIEMLVCVLLTFTGFLFVPTCSYSLLIPAICGLYLTVRLSILCLQLYKHSGITGLKKSYSKMSSRFFATSLFMMILASGQLAHICINMISPILPFSGNLMLKHNYLAFSFPISLCIMGCIYDAIERKSSSAKDGIPLSWNVHYFLLVGGVFSLFFTILFTPWIPGHIPLFLSVFFSSVLVVSIIVFGTVITGCQNKFKVFEKLEWKYYRSAAILLTLAGLAGLMLGYRWPENSPYFYLFLQGHMHLALAGWACFGMLGTVIKKSFNDQSNSSQISIEKFLFATLHSGVLLLLLGIWFRSPIIRASGGILFAVVFLYIGIKNFAASTSSIKNIQ